MEQQVILERDAELAALAAAIAAAEAGRGTLALVEGPAGIGKTTLLRAACQGPGARVLTARGLALEQGFAYGIVRQLLDPVRGEDGLMDGAAALAARVFDWAEAGPVEDDVRYAAMHGLYWLVANLAARQPLVLAVDDAHWADAPSLRWLAHLAARVEHLPVALLLAVRDGPDEPELLGELRAAGTRIRLGPLGPDATAALVRRRLGARPGARPGALVGDQGDAQLGRDWHASTGGNPFLLEALATALRDGDQKAEPIAQAVLRRIAPEGPEAGRLTRALAVLGGPAPLRQAAALAGLDLPAAARLADRLRAADVLAPGSVLEFAHPIVRTAVYESIPPGERALAHAEAARLLERDGADAERLALHLLRSEPGGDPRVAALLRAAAAAATGRGAPGAAAACLRRALDEPPPAADRPGLLLELGIALARERSPAAVPALREAVELAGPDAALLAARVLGIWAYHAEAAAICRDALDRPVGRVGGQRRAAGRHLRGRRCHRARPGRHLARFHGRGVRAAGAHLDRPARGGRADLRHGARGRQAARLDEHGRARQLPALDDHAAARAAGRGGRRRPAGAGLQARHLPAAGRGLGRRVVYRPAHASGPPGRGRRHGRRGRRPGAAGGLDPHAHVPPGPRRAAGRAAPPGRGPG